jgi:hypothetical protein
MLSGEVRPVKFKLYSTTTSSGQVQEYSAEDRRKGMLSGRFFKRSLLTALYWEAF